VRQHQADASGAFTSRRACPPVLFFYGVTSSCLEGTKNALADWGLHRDAKLGKMQIVIGLLRDEQGEPVSTEVVRGNTSDGNTFAPQVKKVDAHLGCKRVTFVSPQFAPWTFQGTRPCQIIFQ